MKSLSIWFIPKQSLVENPEVELHFNHWKFNVDISLRKWLKQIWKAKKLVSRQSYEYFLDFGLRVKRGSGIESICLFLPYEYESISTIVEDLGDKLYDKKLLTAVFNEKYDPRPVNGEKYFEVKKGEDTKFNVYIIDVNNDLKLERKFGGTILHIPFNEYNSKDTYYRIRLKSDFVKKFSRMYRPNNNFLESAFSSIELIDFRVNDTRNMDLSLLEHIGKTGKYFDISLVHFFIMRDIGDEYILSDIPLNSIRQLEENTWHTYFVDSHIKYKNTIAYHLKVKATKDANERLKFIEDYNALIKFRFGDSQLFKYFIYITLFALLTAVVGNTIFKGLESFYTCCISSFVFKSIGRN